MPSSRPCWTRMSTGWPMLATTGPPATPPPHDAHAIPKSPKPAVSPCTSPPPPYPPRPGPHPVGAARPLSDQSRRSLDHPLRRRTLAHAFRSHFSVRHRGPAILSLKNLGLSLTKPRAIWMPKDETTEPNPTPPRLSLTFQRSCSSSMTDADIGCISRRRRPLPALKPSGYLTGRLPTKARAAQHGPLPTPMAQPPAPADPKGP